jgi:hypothetical protein
MAWVMSGGRILAEFADYPGMLTAIRTRVNELAINGERFDEFAGLPRGYLSKLIGIKPVRRIGMTSLGPLFDALGIYCLVVENEAATARLKSRIKPRNNSYHRATYTMRTVTDRQWSRIQKLGRAARWQKLPKIQRSEIMRIVSHARKSSSKSPAKSHSAVTSIRNGSRPAK